MLAFFSKVTRCAVVLWWLEEGALSLGLCLASRSVDCSEGRKWCSVTYALVELR
jgi:hypothetical protein